MSRPGPSHSPCRTSWNPLMKRLEPNSGGALVEPGGTLVEPSSNHPGPPRSLEPSSNHPDHPAALEEIGGTLWNPGGTLVEPSWNPGGTLVEPWWNPRGTLPQGRPGPPRSLRPRSCQLLRKKRKRLGVPEASKNSLRL